MLVQLDHLQFLRSCILENALLFIVNIPISPLTCHLGGHVVALSKETAAKLVSLRNPREIEFFSEETIFFVRFEHSS